MNKPIVSLATALCLSTPSLMAQTAGNLTVERWNSLPASFSVLELQKEGITKRAPDSTSLLAGAEWTPGQGDYYGVRMRGTVTVPETGDYTFFIAGDDNTELYLSTDASRFNKKRIAWQHSWTGPKQWDKYATQRSESIHLVAGQKYYIEAQMMEWGGGDHLSIGWARTAINWSREAGAQASQSSTGWGGAASRAIDGNTSGNYNHNSVTHTADGTDNWWQVDLGADREIRELVIWPRTSNMDRLSNFRVSILDAQGTELTGQDFYTQQGHVGTPNLKWVLPQMVSGRTVRIQFLGQNLAGNGYLSLAEVQVLSQYSAPEVIPAAQLESVAPDANDADDDNLPDDWETQNGLDPANALGKEGQYGDFDNDGINNFTEYQLGTNPAQKDALLDGLTRERWENIGGVRITDLTGNRGRFLRQPSERVHVPNIDENAHGDLYATRYRGTVTAPVTGNYTFWLSGDDEAELWLSDGSVSALTNRYGKQKLAWIQDQRFGRDYTSDEDFDRFATQRSRTVHLTAGQHYYIEVLHKEGYGGDHVAVAWQVPGGQREVIPASAFSSDIPEDDDLDDDYLPAAWETQYGLNPADNGLTDARDGQYGDWDQDGLTNFEEYQLGTDPTNADSDGDTLTDKEERDYYGTDPLVSNQLASTLHTQITLGSYQASSNAWETGANGELTSTERRGYIDYPFTVNAGQEGIFEIRITGGAAGQIRSVEELPLEVSLNEEIIGKVRLRSENGASSTIKHLTPWLSAGNYTLRIKNTNYRALLKLRLDSVEVFHLGGLDANSNNIADWVEQKLADENLVTRAPLESLTSPATVEGVTPSLSSLVLSKATTDNQGQPASETQEVLAGINGGFFSHVELNPQGATELTFSFQNGAVAQQKNITWKDTNILEHDTLTIRKGDALKLSAWEAGSTPSGTFTLTLDLNPSVALPIDGGFEGHLPTTAATAVTGWTGLDLGNLTSASGVMQGGWIPNATAASGHHLVVAGNTATFQLQFFDGTYTKATKVRLDQTSDGITAHQIYARYASGNRLGENFDSIGSTNAPAGAGGYGVTRVALSFLHAAPSTTDLTSQGAQPSNQPLTVDFNIPGTHTLTAEWQPAGGGQTLTSTLVVTVKEASFGETFDVMAWNRRTWEVPGIGSDMDVFADDALAWNETTQSGQGVRSFTVDVYETGKRHVLARMPETGEIIARGTVNGFYLAYQDETNEARLVQIFEDGTRRYRIGIVADGLPSNGEIRIRSVFQGAAFVDGGNELILRASDFNNNGVASFYIDYGPTGTPRVCHDIDVFLTQ